MANLITFFCKAMQIFKLTLTHSSNVKDTTLQPRSQGFLPSHTSEGKSALG